MTALICPKWVVSRHGPLAQISSASVEAHPAVPRCSYRGMRTPRLLTYLVMTHPSHQAIPAVMSIIRAIPTSLGMSTNGIKSSAANGG